MRKYSDMFFDLPPPYKDELLHNVCLRYAMQILPTDVDRVMRQLFGSRTPKCAYYPPSLEPFSASSLPHLASVLPDLVENHTLIPYLLTFHGKTRTEQIYRDEGGYDYLRLLHRLAGSEFPATLRWCPRCVQEDRENYGEAYWRRSHQLYGTWMCHRHKLDLVESEYSGANSLLHRPADFAIPIRVEKFVKKTKFRSEYSRFLHEELYGIFSAPYAILTDAVPRIGAIRNIHFNSRFFPRFDALVREFRDMWGEVLARAVGSQVFGRLPRDSFPNLLLGCRKPYLRIMVEIFFSDVYGIDINDEKYSEKTSWPRVERLKFRCPSRICGRGPDHWVRQYKIGNDKRFANVHCPCGFNFKVNVSLAGREFSMMDVVRINAYGDKYLEYVSLRRREGKSLAMIAGDLGISKGKVQILSKAIREKLKSSASRR